MKQVATKKWTVTVWPHLHRLNEYEASVVRGHAVDRFTVKAKDEDEALRLAKKEAGR